MAIERDGSVEFVDPYLDPIRDEEGTIIKYARRMGDPRPYPQHGIGEIVSKKMTVNDVEGWMRKAYPQHANETCGLHVHMSFHHKLNYSRLMTPEYMKFIIGELRAWGSQANVPQDHMFWKRLDPDHQWTRRHCAHIYLGDNQVLVAKKDYNSRGKDYSRYTFINYCDKQHNTVEVRGLPMFYQPDTICTPADLQLAINAVHAVITATNRFLSKIKQREKAIEISVTESDVVPQEFGVVVV